MKCPLHADDFVIDDPAEEIILQIQAKIQPADGSHHIFSWSIMNVAL